MTDITLTDFLDTIAVGDKARLGSLRHMAFIIGGDGYHAIKAAKKEDLIIFLYNYYSAPNRITQLWDELSDVERSILSLDIWSCGTLPNNVADELAKEFKIAHDHKNSYYEYYQNALERFKERYAKSTSKLWLLSPKNYKSQLFFQELYQIVGEMKRVYSNAADKWVFVTRENRTADFTNIVRYCNTNKVTVTRSGMLSKTSALKLCNYCGYEEYAADADLEPQNIRTADSLLVTFPLSVLSHIGGLVSNTEGICIPSSKAAALTNLPYEQLIKKLFDTYLKSKSFDEVSIIKGIKSTRGHNPSEARQGLVQELKYCPIGEPIPTKEFERYLRITANTFARKEERYIVETRNSAYIYTASWEQYEHPLIHVILTFLGALGIVDIAWECDFYSFSDSEWRIPAAFRINPLGAYVLGFTNTYAVSAVPSMNIEGGFTLLPDYTIIVSDSPNRLKHELYFEKLFTKVSVTKEASIYRLDFGTVVRSQDCGITIANLRSYLSASDRPIPENITSALNDWEKQLGRIKLRQVTILECDDAALLEEVIRYKGMGDLVQEKIAAAAVVNHDATGKIKKIIEKNRRFCTDVI